MIQERGKSLVVKKALEILSKYGYGGRMVYVPLLGSDKDKKEKYGVKKGELKNS